LEKIADPDPDKKIRNRSGVGKCDSGHLCFLCISISPCSIQPRHWTGKGSALFHTRVWQTSATYCTFGCIIWCSFVAFMQCKFLNRAGWEL